MAMPPPPTGPEAQARERIDTQMAEAGWVVQDRDQVNLSAGRGVAIREFKLSGGFGTADYLLYVDGKAAGAFEAKKPDVALSGIEIQVGKYSEGLPAGLPAPLRPLPFLYVGTGEKTGFFNLLDPAPRTREIFQIHRPETLVEWLETDSIAEWIASRHAGTEVADDGNLDDARPSSLRMRLKRGMPPVVIPNLWPNKVEAIRNLEASLAQDRPRALIQMATGSGKTLLAVTALYRLIKFGGARRVLFLVDRSNLGEQAEKEFQSYRTPDDNRKFTELYYVQHLTSNTIGASTKVVISTIQRLYSMLRGEAELPEDSEQGSQFLTGGMSGQEPPPVAYNPAIPPEYFDVIVVDECHRSIYTLWRQVLEYFDAYLIGLTATPAAHTYGFFNQNLVMEYPHERAVADGVNVDFEVYRIRTRITEAGGKIEASTEPVVGVRDRRTRKVRWTAADEAISYTAQDLDRGVVAKDQIRTIVRTFRDKLPTELFPGRQEVPKTLIFAKDDSHAEDIVAIVREEFGEGNDFCQKITYKTTGAKPADLIQDFRNSYKPRIAVTVDMIATGTDIRPVEIVMFLRAVQSRVLFEQMKGRGVRIIDPNELKAVTPSASAKTHFLILDCVGVTETELVDTQPLEKKPGVSFKAILEHVALGGTDPEMLSSLASRLARLDVQCGDEDRKLILQKSDGVPLADLTGAILRALDPDRVEERARSVHALAPEVAPTPAQFDSAQRELLKAAVQPLAQKPVLRSTLLELKRKFEQFLDEISKDELLFAGASEEAKARARTLTKSFEEFLAANRDEIEALQFFYRQPYGKRLRYQDIKALAAAIQAPPRSWTPELLWRAYETLDRDKVKGSGKRLLTDIVSLVRFALHQQPELVPYPLQVRQRFDHWMAQQVNQGKKFTPEQVRWLEMVRDHVASSLEMGIEDFDFIPFSGEGGLGRAQELFGNGLAPLLDELNRALVA
jgi:type I restriction enzyme R subunit